jgi:methylenetetrahydrofolate reductase (NADPH)
MQEVLFTPNPGFPREISTPMHVRDLFSRATPTISFEFFPPRTAESGIKLSKTVEELSALQPDFVSVTYGAGGSTRDLTHELVVKLKRDHGLEPVPHLTCLGHSEEEILSILERYAEAGIGNLLALRGDPPHDQGNREGSFANAKELVQAIRNFRGHSCANGFGIGVAGFPEGHPGTPNRLREMDYLKAKVDAGADYVCTQLFFDNRDFYDFRDRCALAGIRVPIIAGIMPITSPGQIHRIADLAAGARFPARLLKSLSEANGETEAVEEIGLQHAAEQCADLLAQGVSGLHFYTLNQSNPTRRILEMVGWKR